MRWRCLLANNRYAPPRSPRSFELPFTSEVARRVAEELRDPRQLYAASRLRFDCTWPFERAFLVLCIVSYLSQAVLQIAVASYDPSLENIVGVLWSTPLCEQVE